MTQVQFKSDRDRQIVDLWLGGMTLKAIGIALSLGRCSAIPSQTVRAYCDRERIYSRDGRSWSYRLSRKIHPDAPLSDGQQHSYWPNPPRHEDDDDDASFIESVLDAADKLNEALAMLERRHEYGYGGDYAYRAVVSVFDSRIYIAIDGTRPLRRDADAGGARASPANAPPAALEE